VFSNDVDEVFVQVNKYRYLEDRLVLVPVAVILVSMTIVACSAAEKFDRTVNSVSRGPGMILALLPVTSIG
jgi:hypothetical protein